MRRCVVVFLAVLFSGCICSEKLGSIMPSGLGDEIVCNPPYIRFGDGCCLDADGNGLCDTDETLTQSTTNPARTTTLPTVTLRQTTSTTQAHTTTTVSSPRTTTTAAPTCFDGIQNQGEEYIDCGGPCEYCRVYKLSSSYIEFLETGYHFRFDEKRGTGGNLQYWIKIKTPDGLIDDRPLSSADTFVDFLQVRVIDYDERPDQPTVYVRYNIADLQKIPANASLLSIGGRSCTQVGEGMCERNYGGYRLRLVSRISSEGARLEVWEPGLESSYKLDIMEGQKSYTFDQGLVIGGFFDRSRIMVGGYSLFYVYER
jgi:hypothetical protein